MIVVLSLICLLLLIGDIWKTRTIARLDRQINGKAPTIDSARVLGLVDAIDSQKKRIDEVKTDALTLRSTHKSAYDYISKLTAQRFDGVAAAHTRLLDYLDIEEKAFPAETILRQRGNKATSEEVWNG